jgi:hypothetical protein
MGLGCMTAIHKNFLGVRSFDTKGFVWEKIPMD